MCTWFVKLCEFGVAVFECKTVPCDYKRDQANLISTFCEIYAFYHCFGLCTSIGKNGSLIGSL